MEYDPQFLRGEFLNSLRGPRAIFWLDVRELPPTPFTEVLVTGPTNKHLVAYLDSAGGTWVSQNMRVSFDSYPHWMPLPNPPFYEEA